MTGVSDVKDADRAADRKASKKSRRLLLQFLIICFPLWLSIKFYDGPYSDLIGNYLAGILFIIISALIVQLIFPGLRDTPLLIVLFIFFSALELVRWQFPELFANVRFSLAGQPIIGEVFSINKIPYYGVGAFIGYFVLKACRIN
jgi:hypothetical protein